MKKLNYIFLLFVFLASLIPEASVLAQADDGIEVIQPDAASGYDTYISAAYPTENYGTEQTITIGNIDNVSNWQDVEDTSGLITYHSTYASWNTSVHHGNYATYGNSPGDYASYEIVAAGFKIYAYKYSNLGIMEVFIDNVSVGEFDLYAADPEYQVLIYSVEGLTLGTHTIKLVNTGTKNALSSDYYINLDYLSYTASSTDTARGLITFDLSSFPNDAVVESATLSLWVAADLADESSTLQAYALTRKWREEWANFERYDNLDGTGASWQDQLWQIAGGDGNDDRLQEPSGEYALAADLAEGTLITIVLTPDDVTQMIRENYFGFLLRTQMESNDTYQFYSSDYVTDPEKRPMLFVTYTIDNPPPDITWNCVDVGMECWPPMNPAVAVPDPFNYKKNSITVPTSFGAPSSLVTPNVGAKMNCTPYPLCKNDFPIYYRVTFEWSWTSQNQIEVYGITALGMPGGDDIAVAVTPCNNTGAFQPTGKCSGVLQGTLEPEQIATSAEDWDFEIRTNFTFTTGFPTEAVVNTKMYLSLQPFTEECADTYTTPLVDTINIDPTIETPVGMVGDEAPVDEQGYPTIIDQIYMLRVQQGPWNDGTTDRYDTSVSTDGTTWETLLEFSGDALCIEVDMTNPDWLTVYFTAPTETFYIRVNDTAGAFADNTIPNLATPLQYVIGLSTLNTEPIDCTSQYTNEEVIASVTVVANEEEKAVNDPETSPIIPGEWYGIMVTGGAWHEDSFLSEDRIDMEFKFDAGGNRLQDWQVLADGSHLVYCESEDGKIIFVQALGHEGQILSLRVNDQDNPKNFADNSGFLDVDIFHADFTRIPHDCELSYNIGNYITQDVVDASATNGKMFGFALDPLEPPVVYASVELRRGMTYALDTTGGPWWTTVTTANYGPGFEYYETQFKEGAEADWSKPEPWEPTLCYVKLDGLGHERIYFQVPNEGGVEYYIRVAGASPMARGEMGWILYEAWDNSETGENCSNYTYDPNEVPHYGGYVDATLENGVTINNLEPDSIFAIEIMETAEEADPPDYRKSGWWEEEGAAESDALQISRNLDDTNWYLPEESPHVLCSFRLAENNHLVFFIKTSNGAGDVWKLRAASANFVNNYGEEIYSLYHASDEGTNPWVSCLQDYTAHLPPLNTSENIPVRDEAGIRLLPMETSPEIVDENGDGIIWWENLWLMPGHFYQVDTTNTMSRGWEEDEEHDGKAAELSSDDGVTWYPFDTHPDVICFHQDPNPEQYWHAIFEVTEGQKWRIRVADEAGDFGDNDGSLFYTLYLVNEFPGCVFDCGGPPPPGGGETYDVCALALVKPEPLTLSEIANLGNYLGEWYDYATRSVFSYFAWCQRHTDIVQAAINELKMREPYGSIEELDTIAKNIEADAKSYDWDRDGASGMNSVPKDTSIFDFGNSDGTGPNSAQGVNDIFEEYIMPQSGEAYDVWDGGDPVNFEQSTGLPEFYYSCDTVFAGYLPSRIRSGVCFASAYFQQTGASFWVQLALDISAIFLMFAMLKGSIQSLVYMITGVRIWTKDGALRVAGYIGDANVASATAEVERQAQFERERILRELEEDRRMRGR